VRDRHFEENEEEDVDDDRQRRADDGCRFLARAQDERRDETENQ
jgi:hypothetical protein